MGTEAAEDLEWLSELFGRLVQDWPNAKGKPDVAYVDITGARWESKAV